jgi:hypothetical protein
MAPAILASVSSEGMVWPFSTGQVAAQQAGALFDVALGHAFLQPVVSDGLADVHRESTKADSQG